MRRINSQTFFSPSDLSEFASCRHATSLYLISLDTNSKKKNEDPMLSILKNHGDLHEKNYLDRLKKEGRQVVEIPKSIALEERHRLTIESMRQGAEVIFQAALEDGPFQGFADFLFRINTW